MQAVVLRSAAGPAAVRVERMPDPAPGPNDVIVQVRAAALNHRDVFICRGQYAGLHFPAILGADGTGVVAEVGSAVTTLPIGAAVVINPCLGWGDDERVAASTFRILGMPDNGTFAELVKVPAANVLVRPAALSDEEAAALPLAGLTAFRALVSRGRLQAGERVLITGAGGGVATLALLMARHLGARVFVTSGSEEKLQRARDLGAEGAYNYRLVDWVRDVRTATDGGPDLIVDGAGGPTFEQALDAARPGGRIVSYGATAGNAPELTIRRIFWKQLSVFGTTMGSPADFAAMLELVGRQAIHPVLDRVYPLADAGAALERLDRAEQFGKIVLRVDQIAS